MPKPDPALLDPARYSFHCEIQTRFGDLDTNLHLNNVALAAILEDARVRFYAASGFNDASQGMATMVVSLAIEFIGQAYYPAPLDVHVAPLAFGRTSSSLCQLATQEGRTIAFAQTTFVAVRDDRPVEIPPAFVVSAQPFLLKP
ncbi:MAG: acyl-CoA thioesterase [Novosphingobium sp.]